MPVAAVFRTFAQGLYTNAERLNLDNMRAQLALATSMESVLDLGCGDGRATKAIATGFPIGSLRAIEGHEPFRAAARALGIDAVDGDLERRLPFDDATFDVVLSNQVIEHLADTDGFLAEIKRILRPGGLAVVSTENMASWHNIAALVLGFQPFSTTNFSNRRYPLGNPVGLHAGANLSTLDAMLHRRVFTTRALRELVAAHGFAVIDVRGSGYHPFPPAFGRADPSHAHFISVAGRKPA